MKFPCPKIKYEYCIESPYKQVTLLTKQYFTPSVINGCLRKALNCFQVEDFLHQSKICLIKEESPSNQKSESVLSSFYSYFTMSEPLGNKGPSPEEEEATKVATKCIQECKLEQLIVDSKFLREESLHELIKVRVGTVLSYMLRSVQCFYQLLCPIALKTHTL